MSKQVNVKVDAGESGGVQEHLWRFIGYDECNYTYIPEGMELTISEKDQNWGSFREYQEKNK